MPPRIPGESTIMAEVEVMNVMDTGDAEAYIHMPISARKEAPFDMCLQAVRQCKKDAKDFFQQKRYERVRTILMQHLSKSHSLYQACIVF